MRAATRQFHRKSEFFSSEIKKRTYTYALSADANFVSHFLSIYMRHLHNFRAFDKREEMDGMDAELGAPRVLPEVCRTRLRLTNVQKAHPSDCAAGSILSHRFRRFARPQE